MASRRIELSWTCGQCGTTNLGRHTACQSCGDPKDGSERYVMPGDTAAAPTVTDPALLKLATAGANWRCAHCGSDQRAADGACQACGASAAVAAGSPPPDHDAAPEPTPGFQPTPLLLLGGLGALGALAAMAAALLLLGFVLLRAGDPPRAPQVAALAVRTEWTQTVSVERYALVDREGFAESRPRAALDVRDLGPRHHHDDQVPDGTRTETWTEEVPDGYDTETYTERVACGQDCTELPESCHEVCNSSDNGFAECHDECSGGGRDCSTRYCDEQRTRQVPRTRTEVRTREVPKFRAVPVQAEWFAWREWTWVPDREVVARGANTPPTWPSDAELHLGADLGPGEQERAHRRGNYRVLWQRTDDGTQFEESPSGPEALPRYGELAVWDREQHRLLR